MRLLLQRFGHLVEAAHDGREGVEKARSWRPEVVLCDLGLPEMDGYEVARTLALLGENLCHTPYRRLGLWPRRRPQSKW